MRKIFLAMSMLAVWIATTAAHTIGVGYAQRQLGMDSGMKAGGKDACSAAIMLGDDRLAMYAGNEIRTVRVSLPKTNVYVDSVVVWVRGSLDGADLSTGKITRFKDDGFGDIAAGWSEIALAKPVGITRGSKLYVGYTYYQRMKVCATRIVETDASGVSFVKLGSGAQWEETQGCALAIEAGVDGGLMPANDVWLMSARGLILGDGTRQVEARIYNRGQKPTESIGAEYDGSGYRAETTETANVQPDCLDTLTFTLDGADAIGPGAQMSLNMAQVNGAADENPANNSQQILFNYLRIVLVEEFTTEQCPNCPRVAGLLHDILEGGKGIARHIAVVCHHSGYHTDRFTTATDQDYLWFYNDGGGSFAPSLMYNRTPLAATSSGTTAPTTSPQSRGEIEAYVKSISDQESALIIAATARLDGDGKRVSVKVNGSRLRSFGNGEKRITVFLTEDNVAADAQAGSGTDSYNHQHVMRGINATWGEPVEWQGDSFDYSCTFDIDPSWKKGDLKVIASVGDYDSTDPANCVIENTAVAIPSTSTGIGTVGDNGSERKAVAFYSTDGRRLSQPSDGICIVRYSDGSTRKVVGGREM